MKTKTNSAFYRVGFFLKVLPVLLIFLYGCGNEKKATETAVNPQRKAFKEAFHQANSEKMIGHYEKAIALFESCLKIEPNNAAVHFALSDLYEKEGDAEKAMTYAQQAYNFDNSNKWYILRLADLHFAREEFAQTADLYAKIIDTEKNLDLKYTYTEALMRSGKYEQAIAMLNEIEVETGKVPEISFTKHDLYLRAGDMAGAEKELSDLIEDNPSNSDYKIMVAEFYMQQKRYTESEKLVRAVLNNDPNYGQAYIMLADLELRQDNVKGAFENLEKGFSKPDVQLERKLELIAGLIPYAAPGQRDAEEMKNGVTRLFEGVYDPELKNDQLHELYGYFLASQGNFKPAMEQYQLACALNPGSYNSWIQLLQIENELGDYAAMQADGEKAVELFPSQPIFYLLTGVGAKEAKDFEKAEEFFYLGKDLVVKNQELTSEFLYQLGDMNYLQGNAEEGAYYFEQALQAFPGNLAVYKDLAMQQFKAGDISTAETTIKKGLDISPNSASLLDIYGQILMERKEYASAADAFFKALYENLYDPGLLERCGDAFFLSGQEGKALELWSQSRLSGNESNLLKRKLEDKTYYPPAGN